MERMWRKVNQGLTSSRPSKVPKDTNQTNFIQNHLAVDGAPPTSTSESRLRQHSNTKTSNSAASTESRRKRRRKSKSRCSNR